MKSKTLLVLALCVIAPFAYSQNMVVFGGQGGTVYLHSGGQTELFISGGLDVKDNADPKESFINDGTVHVKGDVRIEDAQGLKASFNGLLGYDSKLVLYSDSATLDEGKNNVIEGIVNQGSMLITNKSKFDITEKSKITLIGDLSLEDEASLKTIAISKIQEGSEEEGNNIFIPMENNGTIISVEAPRISVSSIKLSEGTLSEEGTSISGPSSVLFDDGTFVKLSGANTNNGISIHYNVSLGKEFDYAGKKLYNYFASPITSNDIWAAFDESDEASVGAIISFDGRNSGNEALQDQSDKTIQAGKGYLTVLGNKQSGGFSMVPTGGVMKLAGYLSRTETFVYDVPEDYPSGEALLIGNPYLANFNLQTLKNSYQNNVGAIFMPDGEGAYNVYDFLDEVFWEGTSDKKPNSVFASGFVRPFTAFWMSSAINKVNANKVTFGSAVMEEPSGSGLNNSISPTENMFFTMKDPKTGKSAKLLLSVRSYGVNDQLDEYDIPNLGYEDDRAFITFSLKTPGGDFENYIFQNKVTPKVFNEGGVWPIEFKNIIGKSGFEFEFKAPEGYSGFQVFIDDIKTGRRYDMLADTKGYQFKEGQGRYSLIIGKEGFIPEAPPLEDRFAVTVKGENITVIIPEEYSEKCTVSLVDALGRQIPAGGGWNQTTGFYEITRPESNSVYLVLIVTDNGQKITKKIRQ